MSVRGAVGAVIGRVSALLQTIAGFLRVIGLALALLVTGSAIGFAPAAMAAPNAGCTVAAGVANCSDVPTDGISYTNGPTTVNITNGTAGPTAVTSGTDGIFLKQSGGNTSSVPDNVTFTTVSAVIGQDSGGHDITATVVAVPGATSSDPATPYKIDVNGNSEFIVVASTDSDGNVTSYTIQGDPNSPYTPTALATHLNTAPGGAAGSVTAGLTINNPSSGGTAASFTTTNADGLHVESVGGTGGNGGCTTILLATWCHDGDSGGGAGSVAVNNDGGVTVTNGYGVSATSIGGTGGNGGGAFGLFASSPGGGGDGGDGSNVTVILGSHSAIETFGDGSDGVYAISHGGNGGHGGHSSGLVALGDDGGNGGDAGQVTVNNQGSIITNGNNADGIYAESMGAGAGAGSGGGGLVAIGGNGGGQSSGNKVTVTNGGSIETKGLNSIGIFAQSIGGGGGDGGSTGGLFSVGGQGGSGGNSDVVTVNNSGSITTQKAGATALFAQSIGGGGGNGGNALSVSAGASVAIGGNGGLGGNGGKVVINDLTGVVGGINGLQAATITTSGDRANGIQAQSVGGGGGNGGTAVSISVPLGGVSGSFAIGGNGGGGGNADAVTVNEKGAITTGGNQSVGIFAQSIGGGGGNGGGAVSVAVGDGYSLAFSMGGTGGVAGDASTVTVNALGTIVTGTPGDPTNHIAPTGTDSYGIFAQSVGGGGGNGGYALSGSAGAAFAASVALGGGAGGGGKGKDVTVTSGAGISTYGTGAIGIFAQSVGGGGGNGGLSGSLAIGGGSLAVALGGAGGTGSNAGKVTVDNSGQITTEGNNAAAIYAQSVGGGGGNGGMSVALNGAAIGGSVSVGGKGAAGSYGDAVKVTNSGTIITGKVDSHDKPIADAGIDSYGIFAQSVGGGGGNGGMALSASVGIAFDDIPGGSAAISIGGKGGGASNGGLVTVDNTGSIETYGLNASAIYAQSVGGGGGNGGLAGSLAMTIGGGASFGIAVGGKASGGGDGGEVDVNNTGTTAELITNAVGADGIHAQSVGGGGGDGGYALAGALGGGGEVSVNVSVAIGGAGGKGGTGGVVKVTNKSLIETLANQSNGIMAQSVGGGGGDGGMAITGAVAFSETAGAVGVTVGGGGGTGSIGGLVTVDNYGSITTKGNDSVGIFAESVGGTGGNGGLALGVQMTGTTKNAAAIGVTVGGSGGDGNTGGEVDVTNHTGGTIRTTGLNSDGIKAQSVGGGGGTGGLAATAQLGVVAATGPTKEEASKTLNVGVSVGGNGGKGGVGGVVNVINDGEIDVSGLTSVGIFAQSVGGGGGDAGNAVTAIGMVTDKVNDDSRSVGVNVTVGGVGGSGNIGGAVSVNNSGKIITTGASGYGIFGESVGGGGGIGGRANAITLAVTDACTLPLVCKGPKANSNNMTANFAVGGNGGTGGDGGVVKVTNTGDIDTTGDASDGIYAQSIGGGGGNGGNGILGTGEILPVPLDAALIPIGSVSFYKNLSVAVGGNSGATGDGNTVEVDNSGSITTRGSNSNGVTAQSVGGGGGIGGKAAIGVTGLVGVGGKGGAAGDGGDVTFRQLVTGTIETLGVSSDGIFAQSVGGGGGVAGNVDRLLPNGAGPIPSINMGIGLAFGQGGGDGGTGGVVKVTTNGEIKTHGDDATGVFAQSVGGGGGVLGTLGNDLPVVNLLSWHVGSNGDVGDGGIVTVDVTGTIQTAGNDANGIFAQSSGGKGNGGSILGIGGDVTVTVNGSVQTAQLLSTPQDGTAANPLRGLGSIAILAQSVGGGGNGNIEVDLNSTTGIVEGGRTGTVAGVSYIDPTSGETLTSAARDVTGIGVEILDGKNNTIKNYGTITTFDGVNAGYAILATGSNLLGYAADGTTGHAAQAGGNDTVDNFGTVTGSFDLGGGTNAFNNKAAANLNMGAIAYVGAGNLIDNAGVMSPGGQGLVMTTLVTGNLKQDTGGTYGVDLDLSQTGVPGKEADVLHTTGTFDLAGGVDLTIDNAGNALPGSHQVMIAHSDTGLTDTATLTSPATAVAKYELSHTASDLDLAYSIDFAPKGLNPNETSIGNYINNIQTAGGSPDLGPEIAALFGLPDLPSYAAGLDQLIPSPYVVNQVTDMMADLQFENSLLSCKVYDGVARFNAEGECGWVQATGRHSTADATTDNESYDVATGGFAAGVQRALSENLRVGLATSWDNINGMIGDDARTSGNRFQIGGVVKAVYGDTTLAATLTGGLSANDVLRTVNPMGGPAYALAGDQITGFVAGHARLSQTLEAGDWYVRPMVDVGVTTVIWPDMTESGGPVAVNVAGGTNTFVTALPAVEIGGEYKVADGVVARPFLRAGALALLSGGAPTLSAGFIAAPDGVSPFTITGSVDPVMFDLLAGVDIISSSNMTLRASAGADIGSSSRSYNGNVKFSAPF